MSDLPLPDLAAAYPVVKEALHAFAPTIRKGAGSLARNIIDKTVASLQLGFAPYLNTSYDRCKSVKTLLSQDRPLQLLEIYVHLKLKCKKDTVDDDSLINNISSYNRIVITGLAGAGKSLFLKYLTICRFHNPCGTIPVFVELRQLNAITSKDLLAYVHQACTSADSRVTYGQFELALQAGGLLLILDGFDEIDFSHRDIISQQIIEIATKYPAVPMVISSRPDDKFGAWQNFYVFAVCPLNKQQVIELIDKIDYDTGLKRRFKIEVDRKLFQSHQSFLSSPLLSSIMLLTYEQFAEIPNKMHIFYDQAFTALFRRHDATKAQFIRKTYANLALDDLRSFFAAFCIYSYLDEKFSFLDGELDLLIAKCLKFINAPLSLSNSVLQDLHECICMLQKDGIHTTFVHRSFQEYFSAVFIASYNGPLVRSMIDKSALRSRDQVIPMLFEMSRDKLDRQWTLPRIEEILNEAGEMVNAETGAHFLNKLLQWVGIELRLDRAGKLKVSTPTGSLAEEFNAARTIFELYWNGSNTQASGRDPMFERVVYRSVIYPMERWLGVDDKTKRFTGAEVDKALTILGTTSETRTGERGEKYWTFEIRVTPEVVEKLSLSHLIQEFRDQLAEVKRRIEKRLIGQDSIVELLCQERVTSLPQGQSRARRSTRSRNRTTI